MKLPFFRRDESPDALNEAEFLPPSPARLIAGAALALLAFLPLTAALGLVQWSWGARSFAPHALLPLGGHFLATLLLVQLTCTWPLTAMLEPELRRNRGVGFGAFVAAGLAFFTPPLVAYACFSARLKDLVDGYEIAVAILPSLVVALVLYWKSERGWLFTAFLSLGIFFQLFFCNDVLSPLTTYVTYASRGPAFYWWRALSPVAAISAALVTPIAGRFSARHFRRETAAVVWACVFSIVLLRVAIPALLALRDQASALSYIEWDFAWLGFVPLAAFVARPRRSLYRVALASCFAVGAITVVHLGLTLTRGEASFWNLVVFSQQFLVAALCLHLAYQLFKPAVRSSLA
jgi:hypothetical protein